MSFARFFFVFALLFATVLCPVFTSPIPVPEDLADAQDLGRRTTHNGQATYFYPGDGACGGYNGSGDRIVAISQQIWAGGHNCYLYVHITNTKTGKSVYSQVVDECPECSSGSLDMSPRTFKDLDSNLDDGVFPIQWTFMPKGWRP
ncbi:hypothetical protein BS47DRAFT_524946 [Hydnum rufescens UP504]|uniref:RlpA-like protein double-psi beta-barrel domain-containing protein n=1 Tax=Hydnum rufescens UP504 TaxID=1448309 RepID=A0A9P6DWC7_9AGAM|nr:hypothetical protein BS47DRAFT_524946 [Hydnum rufescens UP504]